MKHVGRLGSVAFVARTFANEVAPEATLVFKYVEANENACALPRVELVIRFEPTLIPVKHLTFPIP
jgi:hypothetical protein